MKGTIMKKIYTLIAALMAGIMLLSGCGGNNAETTEEETTKAPTETVDEATDEKDSGVDYKTATAPTKAVITESKEKGNSGEVKLEEGDLYAVISVKDYGDITIKLYVSLASNT